MQMPDGHIEMVFGTDRKQMNDTKELPRYECHKIVWALKIAMIESRRLKPDQEDDGARLITPAEADYIPFWVDDAYVAKHQPYVGGYYVLYQDGYESFSPAKAFEDGYTRVA